MKRIQDSGFTLIELTLTALLILIVTGLSAPLFKSTLSDLSARNTSFNICKLINYAQEMAVLEGVNYKIAFDFNKGSYRLLKLSSTVKPPVYEKASGRFGRLLSMPRGLKISGGKNEIVFYPGGHCDEISVNVLTGAGGYSITVRRFGNMAEVKPLPL
jgi:hypothetical protein